MWHIGWVVSCCGLKLLSKGLQFLLSSFFLRLESI